MLKVSDAFNSAFAAPDRELRARVTIGKTVYDSDDLTSINYDSGAMTGEQFSIGSTYMNSTKITFSHLVEGLKQLDEVLLEFGIVKADGTTEYVKMGTFIIDDKIQMDRNNNSTTIECMDRMVMLGGAYKSKLSYPATIKSVAVEIANMAGVRVNDTSFARLPNQSINEPIGYSYRDAIGIIAQFAMGFALFDRDGYLDIRTLVDSEFKIDPSQYFLKGLVKNETFFKLNGISCTVVTTSKDENGNETSKTTVLQSGSSSGSQIKLANNVMTQDVLDRMYESLKFTNYYPFTLNWNGNPAVEAGDWLTLEDMQGNEFKVPNMSYTLTFNGGLTASSKAETSTNSSVTYSYGGSMSNIVNEIGGREGAEGNHIYEGTEDQKPLFPKEGDLWYKHVGPDTEEWIYKDGKWEFLTSTKSATDAQKAADAAQKEAEEAKKTANESVAAADDAVGKANQAVEDAGFANSTASDAKTAAANAQKDATGALSDAQNALTNSSSAMADSAQARKDSATAKIQAANAATQANQAVTDASTAKADANTAKINATQAINDAAAAKGQATNALGQANTAIGNAADALNKVDNLSFSGRNLLPSTNQGLTNWTFGAGNGGSYNKDAFDVPNGKGMTMTTTVAYPNWFFLGYKLNYKVLKQNTDYVLSFWARSTGIDRSIQARFANSGAANTVALFNSVTLKADEKTYVIMKAKTNAVEFSDQYLYFHPFTQVGGIDIWDLQLVEGTNALRDWQPALEDVQIQIDKVNGELSQKVSQTTYNVLAGTVDTVSTLAKQNQSTIGTLATKTSVDTVNKTATTAQTLAQQNANELLNKASTNTVDTLTQRVTTAESTLSQTATKAELALTKTDVDKLGDTVANQDLDIAATANALKLKADSSTVSDIDGRVTSLSGQLDVQSDLISAKVTASDVTGMLGNYATQTWTQSQINITADGINSTLSSVKTTVDGQTTSINDLKADSSSFKSQFTTVNDTLGKQTTDIGTLQATSKELTTGFNTLTADNGTNKNDISQLKQTATELNSTMMTVQTQVQNSAVGTNLLVGTGNNLSTTGTNNSNQVTNDCLLTNGYNISALVSALGTQFTLSYDWSVSGSSPSGTFNAIWNNFPWGDGSNISALNRVSSSNTSGHFSNTFNLSADSKNIATGVHFRLDNFVGTLTISNVKLEKGSLATDWCPNPADNASVTALSKLSQTVDGMQLDISKKIEQKDLNGYATQTWTQGQIKTTADSINLNVSKVQTDLSGTKTQFAELAVKVDGIQMTVSGKADQSQVTQLAGQITSVVGDVSTNSSQITQMKADINLRVKAGDVVNQINISPEGILIAGQKVHITGQTRIDNAVIKDAMIADIKADKITAGTLNAANVNVINLNANNITTGTIKGANLSMNLNTGEVVFQHGRIHSTSNNVDINVDEGYLSTASGDTRVMLKEGQLQLVQPTIFDNSKDPYLEISNSVGGASFNGANIIARDYLVLANRANAGGYFNNPMGQETFAGLAVGKSDYGGWHETRLGGAERGVIITGGKAFTLWSKLDQSPTIRVGSMDPSRSDRVSIEGSYVHIKSAYWRTASGSANLMVAEDGALVRSTSASKYKTDIIRTNATDYGDKLLNLPTATWTDIAETKRYRDDPANQIKPTRNFGMIAEDLADVGLEMLVVRGTDGELEGINYDRIGPALIPVIAKLKNEVETLKQQLEEKTA